MNRFVIAAVLSLSIAATAAAQTKLTGNTLVLGPNEKGAPATIEDMRWLAGGWKGTGLGAYSEEVYSEPRGGAMMGMYRMVNAEKPVFYEMIIIIEENGSLVYRLKHFNPNLSGWEEKDKTVDFKFIKKDGNRYYFEGLTLERIGRRKLNVYVAIKQDSGAFKEEAFVYSRFK